MAFKSDGVPNTPLVCELRAVLPTVFPSLQRRTESFFPTSDRILLSHVGQNPSLPRRTESNAVATTSGPVVSMGSLASSSKRKRLHVLGVHNGVGYSGGGGGRKAGAGNPVRLVRTRTLSTELDGARSRARVSDGLRLDSLGKSRISHVRDVSHILYCPN